MVEIAQKTSFRPSYRFPFIISFVDAACGLNVTAKQAFISPNTGFTVRHARE